MKGVRGWALLAGVALTAVAVWQVVVCKHPGSWGMESSIS